VLVCQSCRDHIRLTTPRLPPQQQQHQTPNPGVQLVTGNALDQQQALPQRLSRHDSYYINRPPPAHEAASRRPPVQQTLAPEIDTTHINASAASSSSGSNQVSPAVTNNSAGEVALSYHPHVSTLAGPSSQQQQQPQASASTSTLRTSGAHSLGATVVGKGANAGLGVVTAVPALSTPPSTSISVLSPPVVRRPQQHQYHHPQPQYLDPLADITRFRVRSQGHHCLYPGATFEGTQKSGRNSYDVTVTIIVRGIVFVW
jgi:hypothetical protein